VFHNAVKVSLLNFPQSPGISSHANSHFKRKNVLVLCRLSFMAVGKDFFIQTLRSVFNVHYILPGGNDFNVNVSFMPMQNVVFAAKLHQVLSDKIVKYMHSQIYILPLKCGRVQRFYR